MSGTKPLAPGFAVCPGAEPVSGASPTGATFGVHLGDRVEALQHRRADRGAVPGREARRSPSTSALRSVVGGTVSSAKPEKTTRPIRTPVRLVLDERAGRLLRDGQPVGLDVGRAHRAGDVEGEDDRRARDTGRCARRAAGRRRRRARRGSARSSAIGRCRCQRFRLRQHRAQERDARVANGLLAPAAQAPPVRPEERGDDEQRQERERPGERHLRPPARARAIESDRAEREQEPAGGREQRGHLAGLLDAS